MNEAADRLKQHSRCGCATTKTTTKATRVVGNIYGQQLGRVTSLSVQDREIRISRTPANNRHSRAAVQQQHTTNLASPVFIILIHYIYNVPNVAHVFYFRCAKMQKSNHEHEICIRMVLQYPKRFEIHFRRALCLVC